MENQGREWEEQKRAAVLKHLFETARKMCEKGCDMTYLPLGAPDTWPVATAKVFAENLRTLGEQLYLLSEAFQKFFPVSVEMTPVSMSFLNYLGVPKATIAEKADLARGTVYSQLDDFIKWARESGALELK